MADVAPDEGFLQKQLECGVCLTNYDLKNHVPMALFCQHTFCNSCVDTMAKKSPLKCPKCKRVCEVDALRKNFALCDVLEKMCEFCQSGEIVAQCEHCKKQLCSKCMESHVQTLQGDVKSKFGQLRQEVKIAAVIMMDETVLDRERSKAAATIEEIQQSIAEYQRKIKKLNEELNRKVTELKNLNIRSHVDWQKKIAAEIEKCKEFLISSDERITTTFAGVHPTMSLSEINGEAVKFLADLRDLQKSPPDLTEYKFVESQTAPDVGDIWSQPAPAVEATKEQTVASSPQPAPDYTRARSIAVRGGEGYGREEFAGEGYVTCNDDRYIVSDTYNHRVKVYNKDFNLVSILGGEGDQQHQFRYPRGLCVSPSGDMYVCDSGNNQVKVYDKSYRLIRTFGSKGSGDDQFNAPENITISPTGELLVTDSLNYRVKVLTVDGTFVRSFGSRGEGPGKFRNYPQGIAMTPDNHVLVSEDDAPRLLVFTLSGEYVRDIVPTVPNVQNDINIRDVTVDRVGNIIIADRGNNQLIVLNDTEEFVCVVGREGDQSGQLNYPWSVAVNSNNIIVYEWDNYRIQLYGI